MNSIKCPECGLVNFATATECKRCRMCFVAPEQEPHDSQYQHADYQRYWPQRPEFDEKTQRIFSGGVVFLTGILIVTFAMLVMQQAFHPLDRSSAQGFALLVGFAGLGLLLLTQIWLVIRIFEQSIGWGLAALFVPFCGLIAVGKFWEKTKRSFVGQMVCVGIVFVGFGIGV
jgi:hypothetical protein